MFDDKQLKIIYELIGEILASKAANSQPFIAKTKRRGIYDHQITGGVTDEMYERINDYCLKRGICKAELVRTAVNAYLDLACDPNLVGIDLDRIFAANASHV